ncbi:CC0125/CC1285 family lipoprotein [Algiphilus aromaticivorans]|uniref:CC0125/CC1285 family lipoprotein n=1 Tax=Algiphilus aromaticivorans TaxID=382454 RepID=UPI0006938852|nr:hypothetical protein [Algiphilus aromaticivorans]
MLRVIPLTLVLFLAACATATPYQPKIGGYGYAEQRIAENRFRVTFSGNSATERSRVEDYLLYRAAEITLSEGGTHFLMMDSSTEAETTYTQTINTGFGFGHFSHFGAGIGVGTSRPQSSSYDAQAIIVVLDEATERDNLRAFNARDVKKHIGERIERPEA